MDKLTHIDEHCRPAMVDVSGKAICHRTAKAEGRISLCGETVKLVAENRIAKGGVLMTAEIAGVQAAKRTAELIPLCHPLAITKIAVRAELEETSVCVKSEVICVGQTGIEMEALTAVSIALLTIYDMCKAVDKSMVISGIRLVEKNKKGVPDGGA
ncbi:MAG: cyclic pyranopterin monophosphate synthase MoaC [Candidatus Wallbacteria bacterium]|nr:cyclic pyranopterin monophosphate synthase MoaC [Candidatus Wallbacteria bacterium]